MRILYGIQGTGNGHLTRARALAPALEAAGLDVTYLVSGRKPEDLFDMDLFGDFLHRSGLTFVTEAGKIQILKTLTQSHPIRFIQEIRHLDLQSYDLVLSDFEPISAWAAKLQKIPSLAISHQASFKHSVPKVRGHRHSRAVMNAYAPTSISLGVHWYHFDQPLLPPLIGDHTPSSKINRKKIVMYLNFERLEEIIALAQPFIDYEFHIFAAVNKEQTYEHITVHPLSYDNFHAHLKDCNGVISNAGFELASECIKLGKKLLVKPLHGQFEQLSNALALEQLDRGSVMNELNPSKVREWLDYAPPKAINYPSLPQALANWIVKGNWQKTDDLIENLWQDIEIGDFSKAV